MGGLQVPRYVLRALMSEDHRDGRGRDLGRADEATAWGMWAELPPP